MKRLQWSHNARSDMAAIDAYYRPLSTMFAQRVIAQAVAAGRMLQRHPQAGKVVNKSGLRKWRVAQTPYVLLYRETLSTLRIVRVFHAAQDWRNDIE